MNKNIREIKCTNEGNIKKKKKKSRETKTTKQGIYMKINVYKICITKPNIASVRTNQAAHVI